MKTNKIITAQWQKSELTDWFVRNMGKWKPEKMGSKEIREIKYSCWDRVSFPKYKDFYCAFGGGNDEK